MDRSPTTRAARPPSPCISICTLDERDVCMGCARTLDEIVRWSTMSGAEQWQIVERVSVDGESRCAGSSA